MKKTELDEILKLHKMWLNNEEGGKRADLRDADLRRSNLSGANLIGAIKMSIHCKWSHGITDGMIHIGCEKRNIEDWDNFFASDEVITTERNTDEFKQIEAVYNAYKAYILTLNK